MFAQLTTDSPARRFAIPAVIALSAVVSVIAAKLCLQFGLAWTCPLIALLHVPCPSCGTTRAFASLANLDLLAAIKFNPLIVIGLFALPFVSLLKRVPAGVRQYGWWIFGAIVALNWVYLFLFLPR
jgi:hypothetical protein